MKRCTKCQKTKPAAEFYKSSGNRCRSCVCETSNANRHRRAEQAKAAKRAELEKRIQSGRKTCSKCKTEKQRAEFHRRGDSQDGLFSYCKACHVESGRRWWKNNPGAYAAFSKVKRSKDPEKYRRRSLEDYYARRAHYLALRRERKWPHKYGPAERLRAQWRRARLAGAAAEYLTEQQWDALLEYFDHRCAYCLQRKPLSVDHIEALSRGGAHVVTNVVPACKSCNSQKGNRPVFLMVAPNVVRRIRHSQFRPSGRLVRS